MSYQSGTNTSAVFFNSYWWPATKYINVTVPIDPVTHTFAQDGDCYIAGVDGTAAELKVNFLDPAGSKTGKLLPTESPKDMIKIPGFGKLEATIVDVSNPIVLVRAEDIGLTGNELPEEINGNASVCELLEKIRGTACVMIGQANNLADAARNQPGVPKVGFFTAPVGFKDIEGGVVSAEEMDICARVISVFKCHKACPLTAASAISVACFLEGTILYDALGAPQPGRETVRVGHPSGVMTMYPTITRGNGNVQVPGVAVQRTARRIMEETIFVRN